MSKKLLITGGAGFIGSALVRHIIDNTDYFVVNVDKLTYAGNLESLSSVEESFLQQMKATPSCLHKLIYQH